MLYGFFFRSLLLPPPLSSPLVVFFLDKLGLGKLVLNRFFFSFMSSSETGVLAPLDTRDPPVFRLGNFMRMKVGLFGLGVDI